MKNYIIGVCNLINNDNELWSICAADPHAAYVQLYKNLTDCGNEELDKIAMNTIAEIQDELFDQDFSVSNCITAG